MSRSRQMSEAHNSPPSSTQESKEPSLTSAKTTRSRKKSLLRTCFFYVSFTLGISWLGPAFWILISNFQGYVIGGSAWCRHERCRVITFSLDDYIHGRTPVLNAVESDRQNHYLLGALQFVAKAFEIWFMAIAGSLFYMVSQRMFKLSGGLHVGYLFAHRHVLDLLSVFNPSTYAAIWPYKDSDVSIWTKVRLWLYVGLFVSLCTICNFMGPLTAVLLNPSLDWYQGGSIPYGRFDGTLAGGPVSNGRTNRDDRMPTCDNELLSSGNFSCMVQSYASKLDALCQQVVASVDQRSEIRQNFPNDPSPSFDMSTENEQEFWFNVSATLDNQDVPDVDDGDYSIVEFNHPLFAPSRQVIRGLANDVWAFVNSFQGGPNIPNSTFGQNPKEAVQSLQLEARREGPIFGMNSFARYGQPYRISIGNDRQIRCFDSVVGPLEDGNYYAKCYQYGNWPHSTSANLILQGSSNNTSDRTTLDIYWSDRYAYFQSGATFNDWRVRCLNRNYTFMDDLYSSNDDCNWNSVFASEPPPGASSSRSGLVIEYSIPNRTANASSNILISDYSPVVLNGTYSIDLTNFFQGPSQVHLSDFNQTHNHSITLNAAWSLAAWTSSNGSTINGSQRPAASLLNRATHEFYRSMDDSEFHGNYSSLYWGRLTQVIGLQMLSLITHNTMDIDTSVTSNTLQNDINNPLFHSYFNRQVWKWGHNQQTRVFGVAVTIIGCFVVIARSMLLLLEFLADQPEDIPNTRLIRKALEQRPRRSFKNNIEDSKTNEIRFEVDGESYMLKLDVEKLPTNGS